MQFSIARQLIKSKYYGNYFDIFFWGVFNRVLTANTPNHT